MKRTASALIFMLALSFLAAVGTQLFNVVRANPMGQAVYIGETSPPSRPTIVITSPKNNTFCNANSLSIILNVSIIETNNENYQEFISKVYYELDWLQSDIHIYEYYNPDLPNYIRPQITEFYYRLNLTGIPEGKHNVTFYAIEAGYYYPPSSFEYYGFSANDSSVVSFTIDTTPPSVLVLSVENKTYASPDVSLNFTLSQSCAKMTYSLDGEGNVTIGGNMTLSGLSNGSHNVTVYAEDLAGNVGASETIIFSITEPFPTTLLVAASVVSVATAGIGLFMYFKRRKGRRL